MDTTIDFILQTPLLSNNHTRYFGSAVIVEFLISDYFATVSRSAR